ncbi:MAG: hypothetical protein EAZ92_13790 [Candidatus Kapaibacterium sp.]|nr:MAG: hypothetical protein EAZ92_13790 [Candidatus Kapabacteria bacterium]
MKFFNIGTMNPFLYFFCYSTFEWGATHRGNVGEGQLHLNRENIAEFKKFLVPPNSIEKAVVKAAQRERKNK